MGITECRKRSDAPGSMALSAAMPRDDMARLIDRNCATALEDGRRISDGRGVRKSKDVMSSTVRELPGRPSYTFTLHPCFASAMAQRHPTGPPPTMTAMRDGGDLGASMVACKDWRA